MSTFVEGQYCEVNRAYRHETFWGHTISYVVCSRNKNLCVKQYTSVSYIETLKQIT